MPQGHLDAEVGRDREVVEQVVLDRYALRCGRQSARHWPYQAAPHENG